VASVQPRLANSETTPFDISRITPKCEQTVPPFHNQEKCIPRETFITVVYLLLAGCVSTYDEIPSHHSVVHDQQTAFRSATVTAPWSASRCAHFLSAV
jgi:hypothetical protein